MAKKRKIGAPTTYNPLYPKMLVDFFAPPYYLDKDMTITKSDGMTVDKTEREALPPRFLSGFAQTIGVSSLSYRSTFMDWAARYPDFDNALKTAKELEVEMIRTNAMLGLYNPAFSIFTMKNIGGWRDEKHLELGGEVKINQKELDARVSRIKTLLLPLEAGQN